MAERQVTKDAMKSEDDTQVGEDNTTMGEEDKENTMEKEPTPEEIHFCTFPPLTSEEAAKVKMVDLQKMGRSHKILPIAPDGFIPNSEVRKLYRPIDSSQQLVPIGATKVDLDAIMKNKKTISKTISDEENFQKLLKHYMNDEKMREVSFADAVVDATETTTALAQRINSDEIRRDILDTFYENLDREYGALKMSSVAKRRPRIDHKDLKAEKRAKLLQEKRRKLAEAASQKHKKDVEDYTKTESVSEGSSVVTGRDDTYDATMTSDIGDSIELMPLEDDLDNLPFEDRIIRMFEMLVAELGSSDAVYHMASRVLEEDPKAWYHMKMALSKNERIRYFVDGLRQPQFACDFLISMFGSVVKMMDTLEGALDGTIEDTRLLRLMLNSQEKTDNLLTEFGKARTLAQVILSEVVPPSKNTHFLLRDALRCYAGAVEALASFIDDDMEITEKMLRYVMTSNFKGLLAIRKSVVSKGATSRLRMEEITMTEPLDQPVTATATASPSPDTGIDKTDTTDRHDMPSTAETTERRTKDRMDRLRRRRTIKKKLPPLPKFSESAWKAHLANRLNAAIEVCAETAAMKQVAVALNLDETEEIDESMQANAQGLIMSVFESRMMCLQSICDSLGCRMSSEALLNSALNMQREIMSAFVHSFESKELGLKLLEALFVAKSNTIDKLQLGSVVDEVSSWSPIEGIDRMLCFSAEFKAALLAEVKGLVAKDMKIKMDEVEKIMDTLIHMEEGAVTAINDCLIANRHPNALMSPRLASVENMKVVGVATDKLVGVISSNRKSVLRILASSFDCVSRTEREQKAEQMIEAMCTKFDRDITQDFLQNMASRFDTMQLLHRLERDRNKVLDFVRAQGPQRDLYQVYEAMDKVESLLQKAQRMTKVLIRLQEDVVSVAHSEEGDEAALKSQIHKLLKELGKAGIEMGMASLDEEGHVNSYRRLYEALEWMPVDGGLQGFVDYMNTDEWKMTTDTTAQPIVNEMTGTLRHLTRLATREEVNMVKRCLSLQAQRMILKTEKLHPPTKSEEKFFEKRPINEKVFQKLQEIINLKDTKKAIAKALKEFMQTDEFKEVIDDIDEMLQILMRKVESIPGNFLQLISTTATAHKNARLKAKKKAEAMASRVKQPSVKASSEDRAKMISFASRLAAGKEAKASSEEKPEGKEEKEREAEEAETAAAEEEEEEEEELVGSPSDELKRELRMKQALSTSSSVVDMQVKVTESMERDEKEEAVTAKEEETVKKVKTIKEEPEPLSPEDALKAKLADRLDANKKKKKKKKDGEEAKAPYYEPLDLAMTELSEIAEVDSKPDAIEAKAKKKKVKKAKEEAAAAEPPSEGLESEVVRATTIDTVSKKDIRQVARDIHAEEQHAREARRLREGKKPETISKSTGKLVPISEPDLQVFELSAEVRKKVEVSSMSEGTDSSILTEKGSQLGIIGDLQWESERAEQQAAFARMPVSSDEKVWGESEEKKQVTKPSSMEMAKYSEEQLMSGEKDEGFLTDEHGQIRVAEDDEDRDLRIDDTPESVGIQYTPSGVTVKLHDKVDLMPKKKKGAKGKDEKADGEAIVLPSDAQIEALKEAGIDDAQAAQIQHILSLVTSQPWYKTEHVVVTVNNVCRTLCELLNSCKKTETFGLICDAIEMLHNKIVIPQRVTTSVLNFLTSMVKNVTCKALPQMISAMEKSPMVKVDPLTLRRKKQIAQERGRETYTRTLRVLQTMDELGLETRAYRLELRKHFLSLFPMPALQQADVERMTDEELESFLKPPETVSHEMQPPSLDQTLTQMSRDVKRTGRDTDKYSGGISGGHGGGGGGGVGGSPLDRPLGPVTSGAGAPTPTHGRLMTYKAPQREFTDPDLFHFQPMEDRVERRERDMDRDMTPLEGYDAEDVARKEMELQKSLFLFSDEKPFRGIVAESDLPLRDLALLQKEEEKKRLRVVDVESMGGRRFLEDDFAYHPEDIKKLPDIQLSAEQMQQEKLLPGEELDYGDRRVISLCKSGKDDGKQKKFMDKTDLSEATTTNEYQTGSKRMVPPIEQLQQKKEKKQKVHRKEKERTETKTKTMDEDDAKASQDKLRKIADIGWGTEEPMRGKTAAPKSGTIAEPISPAGARVDVTPATSPASRATSTLIKGSSDDLTHMETDTFALQDSVPTRTISAEAKLTRRVTTEELVREADEEPETDRQTKGFIRKTASVEFPSEDSSSKDQTTAVAEEILKKQKKFRDDEKRGISKDTLTLSLADEDKMLQKLLDEEEQMGDMKEPRQVERVLLPEEQQMEEERRKRRQMKGMRRSQMKKIKEDDYCIPLRARDLMEKLICKRKDTMPDLKVQSVSGMPLPGELTVEEQATMRRVGQARSSAALQRRKISQHLNVAALLDVDPSRIHSVEGREDDAFDMDLSSKQALRPTKTLTRDSQAARPSVKHRAVQDDSKLLQKMLAIPTIKSKYKPSSTVLKRLPLYLRPDFVAEVEARGGSAKNYSKIAAITVGGRKTFGKGIGGGQPILKEVPGYDDPMFRPPSPVGLPVPHLSDPLMAAADAKPAGPASDAVPNIVPVPVKKPEPIVSDTPACNRPSYVTAHDWGRISISRKAWKSGKYSFTPTLEPGKHCLFDELSAKGIQAYGVEVGQHLVRCDLVKMISASIHEAARKRIEKRLLKPKRGLTGVSSIVEPSNRR